MFAAAVSTAKLNPVAARNQRFVAAKAGKYDEELIATAVRPNDLQKHSAIACTVLAGYADLAWSRRQPLTTATTETQYL